MKDILCLLFQKSKIQSYLFSIGQKTQMSSRAYTQEQLSSLLQTTAEEVTTILMDTSPQSHQYFYQNFASLSLKAFKYVTCFLNLVSSNQRVGNTIDRIYKAFTQSIQEFRGRNIYAHSACPQDTDPHEQDEIYHFLNTRNNQIPTDLLNNYQSQRQRLELQQFVQQLESQQRFTAKKVKRKPIPAQQTYSSKSDRKTTLSTDLKSVQQQVNGQIISVAVSTPIEATENRHIQIQTEKEWLSELQQKSTKNVIDNSCQYENIPYQQPVSSVGIDEKKIVQKIRKTGGKKKTQRGDSKLRKPTFNDEASTRSKQSSNHMLKVPKQIEKSIPNIDSKQTSPQQQPNSLKSFKTNEEPNMAICQRVLHIAIQGGVTCDLLTQNGLNKSMRTISRKKIITGGQVRVIKSTTKIDEDQLLISSKDPNLSSWKPELRKEASIFDKVKTEIEESQRQSNQEFQGSDKRERANHQEDHIVDQQYHPQEQKAKSRHYLQPVQRGTRQRVSIVNVKIVDQNQHSTEDIVHSNNSQNISNIKRKTINNSKVADSLKKTNIKKKNGVVSTNFKDTRRQKVDEEQYQLKQGEKLQEFEKINSIEAGSELENNLAYPGQVQLGSQTGPVQILNCLVQLKKIKQSRPQDKENQGISKSIQTNQYNKNVKKSSHSLSSSGDMMMIFSSQNRTTQDQSRFKTLNKESFAGDKPSNNRQAQIRNIQTSQEKLSTIVETGKPLQYNTASQSNFASLSKFRSNQCKTVGNASRSLSKLLNRQNSQSTPIKTSLHRLKKQIYQTKDSSTIFQNQSVNSASQHTSHSSFSRDELKRKLRNRANKDKLQLYLELVEATHKKFCGDGCEHIQRLLEGKDGSINEQLIRLFGKVK